MSHSLITGVYGCCRNNTCRRGIQNFLKRLSAKFIIENFIKKLIKLQMFREYEFESYLKFTEENIDISIITEISLNL